MSTSNLVKAIGVSRLHLVRQSLNSSHLDCAFMDRADIVQYIDLPPREAIYEILRTCLVEIVDKAIINAVVRASVYCYIALCTKLFPTQSVPTLKEAQMYEMSAGLSSSHMTFDVDRLAKPRRLALRLLDLASQCRVRPFITPFPIVY